jgi:hypothetical protein
MGDSLHARGALPAHSETWLLYKVVVLLAVHDISKRKKVFSGMRTEYDPSA